MCKAKAGELWSRASDGAEGQQLEGAALRLRSNIASNNGFIHFYNCECGRSVQKPKKMGYRFQ